jgi:predicted Na+-dependent transporter
MWGCLDIFVLSPLQAIGLSHCLLCDEGLILRLLLACLPSTSTPFVWTAPALQASSHCLLGYG